MCHPGEDASPSAVQLWQPFFNPVITAKLTSSPYNNQGSLPPEQVLSLEFVERYSRQVLFQPIGSHGQEKLWRRA